MLLRRNHFLQAVGFTFVWRSDCSDEMIVFPERSRDDFLASISDVLRFLCFELVYCGQKQIMRPVQLFQHSSHALWLARKTWRVQRNLYLLMSGFNWNI